MKKSSVVSIVFLIIIYSVGIFGLLNETLRPKLLPLSFFNLLLTAGILLAFHKRTNQHFVYWSLIVFLSGYLLELLGVKTGFPFGNYQYSENLGIRLFDVPLIIGVNWLILLYVCLSLAQRFFKQNALVVLFAALSMMLLDMVIEPAAVKLNFWQWQNQIIPLKNYISWFVISGLLGALAIRLKLRFDNPLALPVLGLLFAFFSVMAFSYH